MLNTYNLYNIALSLGVSISKVHFWVSGATSLSTDYYVYRPTGRIYTGYAGTMGATPTSSWSSFSLSGASAYTTAKRLAAEAGYGMVSGSFEDGGTVNTTKEVLWYQGAGKYYSWSGTFPKVVPAESTPATSGGIGAGAWVDRTDVTLRSDVTAHETKLGAHAISGVAGLQDALDGKASASELSSISSSVAAIDTRVTALETRKSTCLVNAVGTGAPHETVSAALPANIAINTRYVLANPFGANVPVIGWAELFYNGKWSRTGYIYSSSTTFGHGVGFNYVQGDGIVIQTGSGSLISATAAQGGGGHGVTSGSGTASAPCRVFIQKLGA